MWDEIGCKHSERSIIFTTEKIRKQKQNTNTNTVMLPEKRPRFDGYQKSSRFLIQTQCQGILSDKKQVRLLARSFMASLRLLCCPSSKTPSFSIHPITHKLSSLHNQPNSLTFNINTNNSSFSSSLSFPVRINNRKFRHFVLHFSSTTQDHPVVDSSSLDDVVTEYQSKTEEGEELSKTRLLASNVPWTCTPEDIRALFEKFGTVVDVELSMYNKTRNRGLAFVTMGSPEEAVAALNNLESFEFEGRSLRLNYAKPKKKKPPPPPPPKPGPSFNLFVANLPFEAKSKDLKEFFIAEGANVVSAEIIFHDNRRRSSGYGFVAFKTRKEADEALSTFSEKAFMGRQLRVARSKQFVKKGKEDASESDVASDELESDKVQVDTANDN